jgi:predicted metal-binding membrane protein
MLLMLAVGAANLAWMLLLAAVMALEKNSRWGRRMARPVGCALILGGLGLAGRHLLMA